MIDHAQRRGDLVAGRPGQMSGGGLLQPGTAGGGGELGGAQVRAAVMEQHRPDPLDPALVLFPQIPIQLQDRPAIHHDRRRSLHVIFAAAVRVEGRGVFRTGLGIELSDGHRSHMRRLSGTGVSCPVGLMPGMTTSVRVATPVTRSWPNDANR
jgi:hypothetical protein